MSRQHAAKNPQNFLEMVGNTLLSGSMLYLMQQAVKYMAKPEFANPGGSVKDRAAKGIIEAAEASGTLTKGGVIVEGTAGNTGISLTLAGNRKGISVCDCYA